MQTPGIIKNTGMVNAGINKYLIDGCNIGIPPTDATLMEKNTIATSTKQKPMEYISFSLKSIKGFSNSLFSRNFGTITAPIKKAIKAIIMVITRLSLTGVSDSNKNAAKITRTIKGEKI